MEESIKQIAEHYGYSAQSMQLIEEMADVEIMLEQMKHLMDCQGDVAKMKELKVIRQLERMR